jgi:hypothetical protein
VAGGGESSGGEPLETRGGGQGRSMDIVNKHKNETPVLGKCSLASQSPSTTPKVERRGELWRAMREIEQRVMIAARNGKQRARKKKKMRGFGMREVSR